MYDIRATSVQPSPAARRYMSFVLAGLLLLTDGGAWRLRQVTTAMQQAAPYVWPSYNPTSALMKKASRTLKTPTSACK